MTKALPLLEEHAKFHFLVCKLLGKHVYDGIQAGRPLSMNLIEGDSDKALLDKIDQAVIDWKTAHEDMTEAMEDSDEEIVQDDDMDEDRIEGVEHDHLRSRDHNVQGKKTQHASAKLR
jgi:hypothetical protein